jgi:predicted DNA-binding WGR domain protein
MHADFKAKLQRRKAAKVAQAFQSRIARFWRLSSRQYGRIGNTGQECLRYANTSKSSLCVLALKKVFNQSAGVGQAPAGLEV